MWPPFTEAWPHSATEMEPLFTIVALINLPAGYGNIFNVLLPYGKNKKIWTSEVSSCKVLLKIVFYAYYLTNVNCYNYIALVINGALVGDTNRWKRKYWKKTCPNASLCITNPTWNGLWLNLGLWNDRPVTNHLSHGTALHMVMINVLHIQLQTRKISGHMSHVLMPFNESKFTMKL